MASSPQQSSSSPDAPIEEEDGAADLPMTMAASVVLDQLPKDAHRALETAGELEQAKVTVRLSPLPNTPQLKQPRFKCSSNQRFEYIVRFLRRKLGLKDSESVFCYVNSVFAPGLDEGVGNLWRCFKVGDELVVNYSITQAFG
ncbi:Ubiquitin-like protein ATG12 [Fulvia fulva]|uniref:Ubiquitin-like protein ATG12 n=1 Tax=Passalora fulva TaxID=5499 RepID=A0A9Q8L8H2_PASFU|nr:Ubiquitin-like protein ATG12 [Fulvia fulva]KAK4636087.1 Ubiquitin-like protein ATG12 [Fulvia fulva]KAK4637650.1 Ubiquitin-like protein ATG12 [Fulvia fulva]UJO12876.1 Ubiquitin-like protein ATG12 [Fulvia fulva]WPV09993.1 Ubiquitin-like protein ATG12 [Fulvia fulva]WPV24885.1 Ubiquitin-like protein ATG12 [Fulvia fulva]